MGAATTWTIRARIRSRPAGPGSAPSSPPWDRAASIPAARRCSTACVTHASEFFLILRSRAKRGVSKDGQMALHSPVAILRDARPVAALLRMRQRKAPRDQADAFGIDVQD